jgi:hypothetical protein
MMWISPTVAALHPAGSLPDEKDVEVQWKDGSVTGLKPAFCRSLSVDLVPPEDSVPSPPRDGRGML